ncbi:ACP phosphodiesterase [Lentisphaerota bacterium ZTH]|nr:DUF479 domain-containing protein [Lentisphaerota bacterium]WET05644.1 ACP phosphodiesterase [Lentisphaerota bacterium ZTH]
MNYLAHMALAPDNDNARIGNYLGDFIKGLEDVLRCQYSQAVVDGIMLHRRIDQFTDSATEFNLMCAVFRSKFGRVAPIIVDVMLDHLLIRHWDEFMSESFETFLSKAYRSLHMIVNDNNYPEKCRKFTRRLIERDAFNVYSSMEGIHEILCSINRRLKNRTRLPEASPVIINNFIELDTLFIQFFPKLKCFSEENS